MTTPKVGDIFNAKSGGRYRIVTHIENTSDGVYYLYQRCFYDYDTKTIRDHKKVNTSIVGKCNESTLLGWGVWIANILE